MDAHAVKVMKLAVKLYETRDTAKTLYGERYLELAADYARFVAAQMRKSGTDNHIEAAMQVMELLKQKGTLTPQMGTLIVSGALELAEGGLVARWSDDGKVVIVMPGAEGKI